MHCGRMDISIIGVNEDLKPAWNPLRKKFPHVVSLDGRPVVTSADFKAARWENGTDPEKDLFPGASSHPG